VLPIGFTLLAIILIPEIAQAIKNALSGISTEAIYAEKAEGSGI
jgi:hypothetical protein